MADLMEETGAEVPVDELDETAVKTAVEIISAEVKPVVYADDNETVQVFGQPSKKEDCECNACVIS